MDIGILLQMSGIINQHSARFEASVPNGSMPYMKSVNGKLHARTCRVLKVKAKGKDNSNLRRKQRLLYELDIERVIRMISRHNPEFAERVNTFALTAQDVEIIVRRATYRCLRLGLTPSAFLVTGQSTS